MCRHVLAFARTTTQWLLQEVPTRLPGRLDAAATSFGSTSDLTAPLIRACRGIRGRAGRVTFAAMAASADRTGRAGDQWDIWPIGVLAFVRAAMMGR
jgi:hypothetical protein